MASVNNNSPVSTNYSQPTTAVQNGPNVGNIQGSGSVPGEVDQGSLSGTAAAELKYAMASLDGIDWTVLTNDMALAANLSVNVTAIMVLLIEVMSQMRQDSRQAALEESQAALESGLAAAEKMKDAAWSTLVGAIISNVTSMITSAMSVGSAASQLKALNIAKNGDMKAGPDFDNVQTRGRSDAVTEKQGPSAKSMADVQALQDHFRIINIRNEGLSGITNALGKMGAATFDFLAATKQAEAQADRATGEYQQAIAQAEQQFMQQLGDAIRALLSGMESVDQAQHKAMGAIYNC